MRGACSPASIPLSPNYFDVLSEEEGNAPQEETPGKAKELHEPQRAQTLNQDPTGKAHMALMDKELEREEADLQLALPLSGVEAQKQRRGGTLLG